MQADISAHDSAEYMSWSHSLKPSASIAVVSCKLFSSQSPAPASLLQPVAQTGALLLQQALAKDGITKSTKKIPFIFGSKFLGEIQWIQFSMHTISLKLSSFKMLHFGVIAHLFWQIGCHSSRFVLWSSIWRLFTIVSSGCATALFFERLRLSGPEFLHVKSQCYLQKLPLFNSWPLGFGCFLIRKYTNSEKLQQQ